MRSANQPIPGATVTASQNGKVLTAVTDESGRFQFADLPPGDWQMEIQMFGFVSQKGTAAVAADAVNKDWTLELRPRPAQRGPAGRGGFQNLNLNQSANMAELATLVAPTAENAAAAATPDSGDSFLVSGSVSRGVQEIPQEDVFARARMEQMRGGEGSLGAADGSAIPGFGGPQAGGGGPGGGGFGGGGGRGGPGGGFGGGGRGGPGGFGGPGGGRRGGPGGPGGQIARNGNFGNRINRGRNTIRGMVSYSLHDSAFDARPYSLTGVKADKASYSQSRYGISVGGPLVIPHIIKAEKTFFFLNYSGTTSSNPFDSLSTVPTSIERLGDFSQSHVNGPVVIYDPTTGAPFPGDKIPASRISPIAAGLLGYIPSPNQSTGIQNYRYVTSVRQNSQNLSLRVNQSITRKDRIDFGSSFQFRNGTGAQLYQFTDAQDGNGLSGNIGWTHNFTNRLINNLRWSLSRSTNETLPFFAYGANVAAALGIQGTSSDPINNGPPNLSFTNFGSLSDASPILVRNQTSSVTDGITYVKGRETFTFGGEYRRVQLNTRTDSNGRGSFTFSGLLTSQFDASGQPVSGTGFDFADFLLGAPQSSSIRYGSTSNYYRGNVYNAYFVDDFKVRANLSLNLGVRYEYFAPLTEKYNRIANLDIAPGFTGVAVVTPDATGPYSGKFPAGLINPDKNNVSPRIGIAWKPWPKKDLLIRTGYGIYYNGSIFNQFPARLASQPPFAQSSTVTTSTAVPLTLATGFIAQPVQQTILNTYAIDRGYLTGYAQTWNFSAQKGLPHSLVIEGSYLGTKGTRLDIERSPNRAAPGSPLSAEERRRIGNAVGFTYESAEGNSIYHSGNLRLTRRFRRGLSANLSYTYSKSIDNASTFGGGGATVAQNDQDLAAERGLSSFDRRHVLALNYIVTSPFGQNGTFHSSNAFTSKMLADWTISGAVNASSGSPFTARVLGNQSNSGGTGSVGSGRADSTGLPVDDGSGYFNPLAFAVPRPGFFGDAGRNTITGPSTFTMNIGLGRSFRMGDDRRRLEFRVDSTNFLNAVNITSIGTVLNANNYGLATNAAGMRTVSMSLRFRF
ncbi:MAG: TonB-dependent receptor [Bryobacteraceae bacterium]